MCSVQFNSGFLSVHEFIRSCIRVKVRYLCHFDCSLLKKILQCVKISCA